MKKIIFATAAFIIVSVMTMSARPKWFSDASNGLKLDDIHYSIRFGTNIGGASPIIMPKTIRGLHKFYLQSNLIFGADAIKPLTNQWSIMASLRIENKDMKIVGKVKTYKMSMVHGDQSVDGVYTGYVRTHLRERMITIPIYICYNFNKDFRVKFGNYISVLFEKNFNGWAYDGYIRVGDPTGEKIIIGNDEETRGNFDFSGDMRTTQFGFSVGSEWFFKRHWGLFTEINWGLTGVHLAKFKTIEQTLYPIFGSLGAVYRF